MKFRCERDVLVDALGTSGRAASGKLSGPAVLSGVHLQLAGDTLHLAGNDRDLTIQTQVTVAGSEDGVVVAPARLTLDIVRAMEPGAVTMETIEDELHIASGRSQFSLRTLAVDEFPRLNPPPGEGVTLEATLLTGALRQVVRAASSDDSRPVLTGVLMTADDSGVKLVATDSYRLAIRNLSGSAVLAVGQKVLVPSRALAELQRLLSAGSGEVTLRLGDTEATFELGQTRLTTRLLQSEYPNYASLIPAHYPNRLTVGREPFLDAIRRVKLMVRDTTTTPVRIAMRPNGIELTVITNDLGKATEEIDAKYEGSEITIAFNSTYLIDGVEAIEGDEVLLEAQDGTKPATLRAVDGAEYLYLLMPVRVP